MKVVWGGPKRTETTLVRKAVVEIDMQVIKVKSTLLYAGREFER